MLRCSRNNQPRLSYKCYKYCVGFCYENTTTVTGGKHLPRTLLYPLPPGDKPRTVQVYGLPVQLSIVQVSILFTEVDRYAREQSPQLSIWIWWIFQDSQSIFRLWTLEILEAWLRVHHLFHPESFWTATFYSLHCQSSNCSLHLAPFL